eukprot:2822029-Rhodomonas_salina.1
MAHLAQTHSRPGRVPPRSSSSCCASLSVRPVRWVRLLRRSASCSVWQYAVDVFLVVHVCRFGAPWVRWSY